MKKKWIIILKSALITLFSLAWFIFIQVEYEIITKPELQNDFPIIKGIAAVYFMGFVLLGLAVAIIFLLRSIKKSCAKQEKNITNGAI